MPLQDASPPHPLHTRAARHADLAELKTIWLEFMQSHESRDPSFALATQGLQRWQRMAEDMIDRDDTFVFVTTVEHRPTGFCLGWIARNPPIYQVTELGFISEIAVAKNARRSGAGTALMAAARAWFVAHGLTEFQLSTAVWNTEAQKFWEALGGQALLLRYRFVL
jgi:ribosomal protein S18 acetylase RimI-like enzyme